MSKLQEMLVVLLIDGDAASARGLGDFLEARRWTVDFARTGSESLYLATANHYDAIVLDVDGPGIDGVSLCTHLRKQPRLTSPILMVSARGGLVDKLDGLEAGADDYLVKPYDSLELEARLRALVRRGHKQVAGAALTVGDLVFDPLTGKVSRSGIDLEVSRFATRILGILMRESPRVVSRSEIEAEVWGGELASSDALRSHVYNLRSVIDRPFATALIHTVPTLGFRVSLDGVDSHPAAVR
jgi:DNA-binding response OmpR family regulator